MVPPAKTLTPNPSILKRAALPDQSCLHFSSAEFQSFAKSCRHLSGMVSTALVDHLPVQTIIEGSTDCVYIKAGDSTILAKNKAYEKIFARDADPVGRLAEAFLNETILPVSAASDNLIMCGCQDLFFWHAGRDSIGRAVSFTTYKTTLLGLGHPRMAILGISRMTAIDESSPALKMLSLSQSWTVFKSLKPRDQAIAICFGRGAKFKTIAVELEVSEKTVENSRNATLDALGLSNQTELIKLLVRLQDNGFCDLGL